MALTEIPIELSSTPSIVDGGNATAITIDSSENVGIGNSAPLGKLTISNAAGTNAPSTVTAANTYLQLGSDDYGPSNNGKFMIGFGFTDATNTNSPAYIGYEEVSTSGDTYGDLTFYTRSVTTDTAPTERMRITSAGAVRVSKGGTAFTPLSYDGLVVQNGDATGIRIIDAGNGGSNGGHTGLGNDNGNLRVMTAGTMVFATGLSPTDELYQGGDTAMTIAADGAIYMGDKAANIAQINIGTQGKASGMEFYPYSSVGTTYSSWDLNLGANISPKLGTTSSGHQIMTSYTASGGSNLRVGFNQLAWQRWTPAELNGKAAHDSVTDKDSDPMFQVTTDGHMRAPYSSAFRTYLSTERTTNGLINSGWTDTSSSGVNAYDRAGDFNTSNGRFTAPVDGVYHFDVMWDSNASQAGINLHVTGTGHTEYNVKWEPTGRTDDSWESKAYSTSVQMDTGDYVELYAVHCTGNNPIHMGSGHWGFFAGHLVS